ncbi:hypothetical protein OROGR_018004 [Orobanche gracilis]
MEWPADLEETLQGIIVSNEFDELMEKPETAGRGGGGVWTCDENKVFEDALAQIQEPESPAFFENVASRIPRKSIQEIQNHYQALINDLKMIENGQFPFLNDVYNKTDVNVDQQQQQEEKKQDNQEMDDHQAKNHGQLISHGSASDSSPNEAKITLIRTGQQRRRGVPWTEEEHQLFLMGLNKYGKGDWRSISRYYVITKTSTQVASHAQKYFRRQTCSTPIDRRRPSIHDIQTVNPILITAASSKKNSNNNLPQIQKNVDNVAATPFASSSCGLMNSMLHDQNNLFLPFNSTFPSDMDLIVDQASAGYPESSAGFIPWGTHQQYNGWTTDHSSNYYNN